MLSSHIDIDHSTLGQSKALETRPFKPAAGYSIKLNFPPNQPLKKKKKKKNHLLARNEGGAHSQSGMVYYHAIIVLNFDLQIH